MDTTSLVPRYRAHPLFKFAVGFGGLLYGTLTSEPMNLRVGAYLIGVVSLQELLVTFLDAQWRVLYWLLEGFGWMCYLTAIAICILYWFGVNV